MIIKIKQKEILKILNNIEEDLKKYCYIQKSFLSSKNIAKDFDFQDKFSKFYKINPYRNNYWKKLYFNRFQQQRLKKQIIFINLLKGFYKQSKKVESSFISKLVHTIDPKSPIIDSIILKNLREMGNVYAVLPRYNLNLDKRLKKVDILYKDISISINSFLKTKKGIFLVKKFKEFYPYIKISKQKMVDFVLWKIR